MALLGKPRSRTSYAIVDPGMDAAGLDALREDLARILDMDVAGEGEEEAEGATGEDTAEPSDRPGGEGEDSPDGEKGAGAEGNANSNGTA